MESKYNKSESEYHALSSVESDKGTSRLVVVCLNELERDNKEKGKNTRDLQYRVDKITEAYRIIADTLVKVQQQHYLDKKVEITDIYRNAVKLVDDESKAVKEDIEVLVIENERDNNENIAA